MSQEPDLVFQLQDKNTGKEWISGIRFNTVKSQLEESDRRITTLFDNYRKLAERVDSLERPIRQKKILDFLSKETKPVTKQWVLHRVDATWYDFYLLIQEGKVIESKNGRVKRYSINSSKEKAKQ